MKFFFALSASLTVAVSAIAQEPVFQEQNGYVVIEAEALGAKGDWVFHDQQGLVDYSRNVKIAFLPRFLGSMETTTGAGCLRDNGGSAEGAGSSDRSVIEYQIQINNPGTYYLRMRGCHASSEGEPWDFENDCYIHVTGHNKNETCHNTPTKFVCKHESLSWGWEVMLECGHHEFSFPVYPNLSAGRYSIKVGGRSRNFMYDRFAFYKAEAADVAMDLTTPQSPTDGGTVGIDRGAMSIVRSKTPRSYLHVEPAGRLRVTVVDPVSSIHKLFTVDGKNLSR